MPHRHDKLKFPPTPVGAAFAAYLMVVAKKPGGLKDLQEAAEMLTQQYFRNNAIELRESRLPQEIIDALDDGSAFLTSIVSFATERQEAKERAKLRRQA